MKARFTFLSGPRRGRRVVATDPIITVGGDPSHTVYLAGLAERDLLARIVRGEDVYTMAACHPLASLSINGVDASGDRDSVLQDGDLIQIAEGQVMCFSTVPQRGDPPKPMPQIVAQSWRAAAHLRAATARRSLFFLRDLCHCTVYDASRRARLGWGATFAAIALAGLLGALSLFEARVTERRVVAISTQVAAGSVTRQRLEQQIARLHQLEQEKADAEARLGEVSRHLESAERRVAGLERQTPNLQAAIDAARRSVALLVVGYDIYEKASGRPLRFVSEDANGRPQPDGYGAYSTSVDGTGPVFTAYATGSGFLIGGGRMVTNRHVAEPWWENASVAAAVPHGFEPRRTVTRAYFPRVRQPVELQVAAVSSEADIAVMAGSMPRALTPLRLAPPERRVSAGDLIVVVAYPTGFDALLARTDEAIAHQIIDDAQDPPALAAALATRNLISPLVTVGHVGDVLGNNIVYDAAATHGSSGGPVLNATGDVIAINYATLESFAGARFGIPVAFVRRLLHAPERAAR